MARAKKTTDEARARAVFLDQVDHHPEDHRPGSYWGPAQDVEEWRTTAPGKLVDASFEASDCRYFWCRRPDLVHGSEGWTDLSKAAARVQRRGHDIHGEVAQLIAFWSDPMPLQRRQLEGYENLNRAVERAQVHPKTGAETIRREVLDRLAPLLVEARAAMPPSRRAHPIDQEIGRALAIARIHKWTYDEVAAVRLLYGREMAVWTTLLDRVRKIQYRSKNRTPPLVEKRNDKRPAISEATRD